MSIVRIVGLGYVGKPLADLALKAGHIVQGVDLDPARCIGDTTEPPDLIIICVPTNRYKPLEHVEAALRANVPQYPNATVIIESTVPIGSTDTLARNYPNDFVFSPERIDPNNKTFSVQNTPKIVASNLQAVAFYQSLGIKTHIVATNCEAEAAKLLENTFRLVNIGLAQRFSTYLANVGIDHDNVISAAATKPFGFMPFYPGVGVGGHCIAVDPFFTELFDDQDLFIYDALDRPAVEIAYSLLLKNIKAVVLIGAAYKNGVPDTRESPVFRIRTELLSHDIDVVIYDPACGFDVWPEDARYRAAIMLNIGSDEAAEAALFRLDECVEVLSGVDLALGK